MAHDQKLARKGTARLPATIGRPSARDAILKTAIDILLADGVEALTYEELARRAAVTKGGILYHFPNRPALNRAIQETIRAHDRAAQIAATDKLPPGASRILAGWAEANLGERTVFDRVGAKIMTSTLWDPEEGRAHNTEILQSLSVGVPFDRTALVYLAIKGLWFLELGEFSPFTTAQRKRLTPLLLRLAAGGAIGPSKPIAPRRQALIAPTASAQAAAAPAPPAEERNARAKILDTALDIINQTGVEALTFERLSEGTGDEQRGGAVSFSDP